MKASNLMSHRKRLVDTVCYAVVAAAPAAATLLLTPILIRTLGHDGFANWSLLEPLITLGAAAITLGAQYGILQRAAADANARFPLSALPIVGLSAPLVWLITAALFGPKYGVIVLISICAAQFGDALVTLASNYYRGKSQPFRMALLEGGRQAVIIAASLIFAFGLHYLDSTSTVSLIRAFATGAAVIFLFAPFTRFQGPIKVRESAALLQYGMPIFIAQIFNILLMNADRYVAAFSQMPPENLTSYVAHLRLASALNLLVVAPLALWFPPIALKHDPIKDAEKYRTIGTYVTYGLAFATVSANVFGILLWDQIFPSIAFNPTLLNILISGVAFQCYAILWNIGSLRPGSTKFNIIPTATALILMVAAGLLAGISVGINGIAFARLLALALSALIFERVSTRITGRSTASIKQLGMLSAAIIITTIISNVITSS